MKILIIIALLTLSSPVWSGSYLEQLDYLDSIRTTNISKVKSELISLEKEFENLNNNEKAKYNFLRAHSESMRGNYALAYDYANKVAGTTRNKDLLARTESLKVIIYSYQGKVQKAFSKIYKLVDNLKNLNNNQVKLEILLNAQTLHTYSEILDKAQELGLQAMALSSQIGLKDNRCRVSVEMALLQIRLKDYIRAHEYLEQASQGCEQGTDKTTLLIIESQIAKLNMINGNFDLAEQQYLVLITKLIDFGWDGLLVDTQIRIAELYLKMARLERLEEFAIPAFKSSKKDNVLNDLADISLVLAKYYKALDQSNEAMLYRNEFIRSSNELKLQLQKKRLAYYQAMNARAKQQEVALQSEQEKVPVNLPK